jgi:hypothetical protein
VLFERKLLCKTGIYKILTVLYIFTGTVHGKVDRGRKWEKNDDSMDRYREYKGIWDDKENDVKIKRFF